MLVSLKPSGRKQQKYDFCLLSQDNHKHQRVIYLQAGVTPRWTRDCVIAVYVAALLLLLLLLVKSNASLGCIGAEMAFWVLCVCTGDSAFESESIFIHYSEVLVNGCPVHSPFFFCRCSSCDRHCRNNQYCTDCWDCHSADLWSKSDASFCFCLILIGLHGLACSDAARK